MRDTLVHPEKIHPHTGKPLVAVGLRRDGRPIWPIMGASEDDEDAGGDDGGDDDDDSGAGGGEGDDDPDDDDDDPDAGKSPEDLRAELRALRNSKAKLLREKRNRERGGGNGDGKGRKGDDDPDKKFSRGDLDEIAEETKASTRTELMPAIIRSQSRTVLESLGMVFDKDRAKARAQLSRVLKLADTDELDLDDDGEVDGLEHALRSVKRDFPQLFRGRRVAQPGNGGGGGRPSSKAKSATEIQMGHVFGGRDDD